MNEEELLKIHMRVKKAASRKGFSKEKSEDFAQEAIANLISNPNLVSQNTTQRLIDVLRNETFNRNKRPVWDLVTRSDEEYNMLLNELKIENDIEGKDIYLDRIYKYLTEVIKLNKRYLQMFMMRFNYGCTFKEISYKFGVSEARICQIITLSCQRIKKKVIQSGISSQIQRDRKLKKYRALSQEVRQRSFTNSQTKRKLQGVCQEERYSMATFKIQKVPQKIFGSFRITAF